MVTYVYICNKCEGPDDGRVFERGYPDIETAESSPVPVCPHCGNSEGVSRFFRHSIYGPGKSSQRDHSGDANSVPRRYVKFNPRRGTGIVSIGVRMDAVEFEGIEQHLKEAVEESGMEALHSEYDLNADSDGGEGGGEGEEQGGEKDFTEDVLGLKLGTVERALFDVRHRNMIEELRNGAPISGFFLPLSGEYGN